MNRLRSQLDQMLQQQGSGAQARSPAQVNPTHPYDEIQRRLDALSQQSINMPPPMAQPHVPQQQQHYSHPQRAAQANAYAPQPTPQQPRTNPADIANIKASLDRLMNKVQSVSAHDQASRQPSFDANALQRNISQDILLEMRNEFAHLQGEMKSLRADVAAMPKSGLQSDELNAIAGEIRAISTSQSAQPEIMHQMVQELETMRRTFDILAPGGSVQADFSPVLDAMEANFAALGQRLEMALSSNENLHALTTAIETGYAEINDRLDTLQQGGDDQHFPIVSEHISAIRSALDELPQALPLTDMRLQLETIAEAVETLSDKGDNSVHQSFRSLESRLDEITRGLVALSVTGPQDANAAELERIEARISALANSMDGLAESTAKAASPEITVETPPVLVDALKDIEKRLTAMEPQAVSLQQIESRLVALEPQDTSALESGLSEIARRLDAMENGAGNASDDGSKAVLDTLTRLDARIAELATRGDNADDAKLFGQFDGLASQLNRLSEKMDDIMQTRAAVAASGSDDAAAARLAEQNYEYVLARLDTVLSRLDDAENAKAPEVDLSSIETQLADLASRIDNQPDFEAALRSMPTPAATAVDFSGIEERLDHLAVQMEGRLAGGASVAEIPAGETSIEILSQLKALSDRLDAVAKPVDQALEDSPQLKSLEQQLASIVVQLNESATHAVDLSPLQAKLTAIESAVTGTSGAEGAADLGFLDDRLVAIEQSLAASRDITIEMASQAAEQAVNQATAKLSAMYPGENAGAEASAAAIDLSSITALADDIRSLRDANNNHHQTNADTFEALGETLAHLVDRLGSIEAQLSGVAYVPAEAPAMHQAPAAAMQATPAYPDQMQNDQAYGDQDYAGQPYGDQQAYAQPEIPAGDPALEAQAGQYVDDPAMAVHEMMEQAAFQTADAMPEEPDLPLEPNAPALEMNELPEVGGENPYAAVNAEQVDPDHVDPALVDTSHVEPDVSDPANGPFMDNSVYADGAQMTENALVTTEEEPTGKPDMAALMRQANNRMKQEQPAEDTNSGGMDFLAVARKAAQAAAAESALVEEEIKRQPPTGGNGLLKKVKELIERRKKIVIVAAAAILLAGLALPFAGKLMGPKEVFVSEPAVTSDTSTTVSAADPEIADDVSEPQPIADAEESDAVEVVEPARTVNPVTPVEETATTNLPGATTPATESVAIDTAADQTNDRIGNAFGSEPLPDEALGPIALRQAAASGDPLAQFEIGRRLNDGIGVEANLAEASKWYEKAASKNFAPAQYRMGIIHEKGYGVERDPAKAVSWYQSAAEQGHALAMHNLAVMQASGVVGGSPDLETAFSWFKKAGDLGVRDSQVNLGVLYTKGMGTEENLVEAYKWFAVAAKGGDNDAASKRDTIAGALRPDQLEEATAKVELWKPARLDEKVNRVVIPPEWSVAAPAASAGLSLQDQVKAAQTMLGRMGFDPGPADGVMGAKTRAAIMAYQQRSGLSVDGKVTPQLLEKMKTGI